jgi:hypothetical protein
MHDVAHVKGRADVGADGERFRRAAAALAAPISSPVKGQASCNNDVSWNKNLKLWRESALLSTAGSTKLNLTCYKKLTIVCRELKV